MNLLDILLGRSSNLLSPLPQAKPTSGGELLNPSAMGYPPINPTPEKIAQNIVATSPSPFANNTRAIPNQYQKTIQSAAEKNSIRPEVLAALLTQENQAWNPQTIVTTKNANGQTSRDRGLAQINDIAFPNVTDQQALDPNFAIHFAANLLGQHLKNLGDINKAIAAYNVGAGGASIQGPTPYGGGPRGQQYIDNVARNLTPDIRKQLQIKTTY